MYYLRWVVLFFLMFRLSLKHFVILSNILYQVSFTVSFSSLKNTKKSQCTYWSCPRISASVTFPLPSFVPRFQKFNYSSFHNFTPTVSSMLIIPSTARRFPEFRSTPNFKKKKEYAMSFDNVRVLESNSFTVLISLILRIFVSLWLLSPCLVWFS